MAAQSCLQPWRYDEHKCLKMRHNHPVTDLLSRSADSAVSTSLLIHLPTLPRFKFHTCEHGRRRGKRLIKTVQSCSSD